MNRRLFLLAIGASMAKGVSFTRDSAVRIRDVVQQVERQQVQPTRRQRMHGGGDGYRILVTKLTEAATQGGTYTCEIWDGAAQNGFSATGETIEVYFRLGDGTSGNWVMVAETIRGYEAIATEC